jgi:hypothetical protein
MDCCHHVPEPTTPHRALVGRSAEREQLGRLLVRAADGLSGALLLALAAAEPTAPADLLWRAAERLGINPDAAAEG